MGSETPSRPILIYDGDCRFCCAWVERFRAATGESVVYATSQEVGADFPRIPEERFRKEVVLVDSDGAVFGGAEAVARTLAHGGQAWPMSLYRVAPVKTLADAAYGWVARHRMAASRVSRLLWGANPGPATFHVSRLWFLRALGAIYVIAFVSLGVQVRGLVGEEGIWPAPAFLESVREARGGVAGWSVPTLSWLWTGDEGLRGQWILGAVLALALMRGLAPRWVLLGCWILYLSLCTVGGPFTSFQWDVLLLEAGLLAALYAPGGLRPSISRETPTPGVVRLALTILLFKLMFGSGLVKLLSQDPTWWDLTALTIHYETQPLPTVLGYWLHQLPEWFHRLSCGAMFFVELVVPFFYFAPRRLRAWALGATMGLMVAIGLSGNYTFFNLLTILLCVPLFDDRQLARITPRRYRKKLARRKAPDHRRSRVVTALATVAILLSVAAFVQRVAPQKLPGIAGSALEAVAPLRSFNGYGLFSIMTTDRPEITIEGSNDRVEWKAYAFRYKPGDLARRPPWVQPHQPRLDWQMWFAALGPHENTRWFTNLMVRLLEGSPDVLALMEENPFPDAPPKWVRARLWAYRFTTPEEKRETGYWWKREERGMFFPMASRSRP